MKVQANIQIELPLLVKQSGRKIQFAAKQQGRCQHNINVVLGLFRIKAETEQGRWRGIATRHQTSHIRARGNRLHIPFGKGTFPSQRQRIHGALG